MKSVNDTIHRHPYAVVGLAAAIVGLCAWPALSIGTDNGIEVWIAGQSSRLAEYQEFVDTFGSDEFVLVALQTSDPYAPWIGELAGALHRLPEIDDVYWPQRVRDESVSVQAAAALSADLLIGRDGRTIAVICGLSPAGLEDRQRACRQIRRVLAEFHRHDAEHVEPEPANRGGSASQRGQWLGSAGRRVAELQGHEFHLGGPPVFNAELDRASRQSVAILLPWVGLLCLAVLAIWTRHVGLAVLPLGVAAGVCVTVLGLVAVTGHTLNMVMAILPALAVILSLSTSIHVVNYYRAARRTGASASQAADQARRRAARPALHAAGTTAVGLASLATSRMGPVEAFGGFGAAAALVAWAMSLIVTPAVLQLFGRWARPLPPGAGPSRAWSLPRRPGRLLALTAAGAAVFAVGIIGTPIRVDPFHYFDKDSRFVRDYDYIENHLTGLAPIEVVLRFGTSVEPGACLAAVGRVAAALRRAPPTRKVLSALDLMGLAVPSDSRDWVALLDRLGHVRWPSAAAWLDRFISPDRTRWRISVRVNVTDESDFTVVTETLRRKALQAAGGDAQVSVTGVVPMLDFVQHEVVRTLVRSFGLALAVLGAYLIVLFRSLRLGLAALAPNVAAVAVTFGTMAWLGLPLDVGTMMIASVAIGISVDDAIHLMVRWRRDGRLPLVLAEIAPAMVVTSATAAVGFGVLAISDFRPTAHFGFLLMVAMLAALAGSLVWLPAILTLGGKEGKRP